MGSSELGNASLVSIEGGDFLDQLQDCRLVNENSTQVGLPPSSLYCEETMLCNQRPCLGICSMILPFSCGSSFVCYINGFLLHELLVLLLTSSSCLLWTLD